MKQEAQHNYNRAHRVKRIRPQCVNKTQIIYTQKMYAAEISLSVAEKFAVSRRRLTLNSEIEVYFSPMKWSQFE